MRVAREQVHVAGYRVSGAEFGAGMPERHIGIVHLPVKTRCGERRACGHQQWRTSQPVFKRIRQVVKAHAAGHTQSLAGRNFAMHIRRHAFEGDIIVIHAPRNRVGIEYARRRSPGDADIQTVFRARAGTDIHIRAGNQSCTHELWKIAPPFRQHAV